MKSAEIHIILFQNHPITNLKTGRCFNNEEVLVLNYKENKSKSLTQVYVIT